MKLKLADVEPAADQLEHMTAAAPTDQPQTDFWISRTARTRFRRLHRTGKGNCADAYCERCWPQGTELPAESSCMSSSSELS
eukprot:992641-Amphidinium_carterae.2